MTPFFDILLFAFCVIGYVACTLAGKRTEANVISWLILGYLLVCLLT